MATTTDEKIKSIKEDIGALTKSVEKLNDPDLSGVRTDGQGRITSYWDDSPEKERVNLKNPVRKSLRTMPSGYKPYSHFKSFGEFIRLGMKEPSQAQDMLTKSWGMCKAVQGMSTAIGAEGGVSVLPEFSTEILTRVYSNDIFSRTDNYQVGGNSMTFPKDAEESRVTGSRSGGLRAYWIGEGDPMTGSKPNLGELELKLNKVAVLIYLTEELIQDNSMALESYVNKKVTQELEFVIGDSIINGDGVKKPNGILNSGARVTVAKESGQAANTIVAENILNMWSRLRASARGNAVWFINQDTEPQLHQMSLGVSTAGGQLVYMPPTGLSGSPYATLMGRPVIPTEFNETLGTEGDIILADLNDYVTISKGGIEQAESMHVEFLTDQMALRFIMRVDGKTWDENPTTPYKGTATQSSFVTLATRS